VALVSLCGAPATTRRTGGMLTPLRIACQGLAPDQSA
jgi:hypothetical protein